MIGKVLMERLMEITEKNVSDDREDLGREKDVWIRYFKSKSW